MCGHNSALPLLGICCMQCVKVDAYAASACAASNRHGTEEKQVLLVEQRCKCSLGTVRVICREKPHDAVLQSIACGLHYADIAVACP